MQTLVSAFQLLVLVQVCCHGNGLKLKHMQHMQIFDVECLSSNAVASDGEQCSRHFHRCINSRPTLDSCNRSYAFDDRLGRCALRNATRCDLSCPMGMEYMPYSQIFCSNKYYRCRNDIELEYCPQSNPVFDVVALRCTTVDDAQCRVPEHTTPTTKSTTSTKPEMSTTEVPHGQFKCPDAGGDIYPKPGRCNQYYLCREGVPTKLYVFTCPRGSYFNPASKQCDLDTKIMC